MMTVADDIRVKLVAALAPVSTEVIDESGLHAGHVGARPEGETHFRVTVIADAFAGKSRLERQRMVYRILAEEIDGPVHALAISARAPGEGG